MYTTLKNLNEPREGSLKVKFHYAICFEAGSKLVADSFEAARVPVADLLVRASSLLAS